MGATMRYQPQGRALLSDLGNRAKVVFLPRGNGLYDVITGKLAEKLPGGSTYIPFSTAGIAGLGLNTNNANSSLAGFLTPTKDLFPIGTSAITIFAIVRTDGINHSKEHGLIRNEGSSSAGQFAVDYFSGPHQIRFLLQTNGINGWAINDVYLQSPRNATLALHITWRNGQPSRLTYRDLETNIIYSTQFPVTPTGVSSFSTFGSGTVVAGMLYGPGGGWPGELYSLAVWNEWHTPAQATELVSQPWQIFEVEEFEDVVVVGGTTVVEGTGLSTGSATTTAIASARYNTQGFSTGTATSTANTSNITLVSGSSIGSTSLTAMTSAVMQATGASISSTNVAGTAGVVLSADGNSNGLTIAAPTAGAISSSLGESIGFSTVFGNSISIKYANGISTANTTVNGNGTAIWQVSGTSTGTSQTNGTTGEISGAITIAPSVYSTSTIGTLSATANALHIPTGISSSSSVGTVLTVANASHTLIGINAVSGVGSVISSVNAAHTLAGVSATSSVGVLVPSGTTLVGSSISPAGVFTSGFIGNTYNTADASLNIIGSYSNSAVGLVNVTALTSISNNVSPLGTASNAAIGNVIGTGSASAQLISAVSNTVIGSIVGSGLASVNAAGISSYAYVGILSPFIGLGTNAVIEAPRVKSTASIGVALARIRNQKSSFGYHYLTSSPNLKLKFNFD